MKARHTAAVSLILFLAVLFLPGTVRAEEILDPGTPGRLTVTAPQMRTIDVSWDAVPGASGYQVRYADNAAFENCSDLIVPTSHAVLTGLPVRTVCYVKVRAFARSERSVIYGGFSRTFRRKVTGKLIVIDAGHQKKANNETEPIGPGAKTRRKKVSGGTRGVATKLYEYELNLTVSLKLRDVLEENGYQVIMVRTKHNVNIPNSERARIANEARADAFIRIHASGSDNKSKRGAFTICPSKSNPYPVKRLYKKCYRLSRCIIKGVVKETGAKERGIMQWDDYTGINYCTVPVTLLEMGFMSNPAEDRLMAKDSYQNKIVKGILNGLDSYFGIKRESN